MARRSVATGPRAIAARAPAARVDVPAAFSDMLCGRLPMSSYISSLQRTRVESVFSADDLVPSFAEAMVLPWCATVSYLTEREYQDDNGSDRNHGRCDCDR